jgi:hypothetical protein
MKDAGTGKRGPDAGEPKRPINLHLPNRARHRKV